MACNFKYTNGDLELVSPSWEGLIQLILSDNTGITPEDYLVDSLNFYNTDADVISEVVSDLTSKDPARLRKEGITTIIKQYLKLAKNDPEQEANISKSAFPEILAAAQDYVNYCQDFGIGYHACIDALSKYGNDSDKYRTALDSLWNIVEKYRIHSKEWTKTPYSGATNAVSFMTSLTSKEILKNAVFNSLDKVNEQLKKYGQDNIVTELRIDDLDIRNGVTGIIDAVTWDGEGNVTIWDFKTTANSEVSDTTKMYRLAQLRAYKELLIKHSEKLVKEGKLPKRLSADKVKIKTLLITQSIINGDSPNLLITSIDPETAFKKLDGSKQLKVDQIIYTIYPREGKSISSVEANAKKSKITRLINPIMSELGITKLTTESQKVYLSKFIDQDKQGKPVILRHLQESQWKLGVSITKWKKEGNLVIGYDASGKQVIKDTLDNIAEKEAKFALETLKINTNRIAGALNGKSYTQLMDMFKFDLNRQRAIMQALEPYLSEEYQYVQLSFLEDEYNILTLKNSATGAYTFIVVSDLAALDHQRKDAGNILAPVFKDQNELKRFKEAKNLPVPSAENLLTLLAMFAINECKDLLSDDLIRIDRILVVSASTGVHTLGSNIDVFTNVFKLLDYEANTNKEALKDSDAYLGINSSWTKNISLSDQKEVLCRIALNRIATFKLTNPDAELDGLGSKNVEDIQQNIDTLISSIEHEYPHDYNNLDTLIGRVYTSLKLIKLTFQSGEIYDKLYKHTRWGLTAAETLGAGIDILRYAESKRFSFNGVILNGIAQGLDMAPSYSSPDKAIAFYEQMFRLAARLVTVELVDLAVPFNIATKKFLRAAGKSGFLIAVTGTTTDTYEALFEQDGDKIAGNMQLKNPYSSFSELVDFQREYAEEVLWIINRLRLRDTQLDAQYRKMSYEEFKKSGQFKNYVELINNNPELLEMPLKLKNSAEGVITNIRDLFDADDSDLGVVDRLKKFGKSIEDRWQQSIQPVLLTPDLVEGMDLDIDEARRHFEYHSPYNKQGENRIQMLNNNSINGWEKNLNILALEYACALFKEQYFLQVLHTVGNLLGEIDLMEVMTGKDLSKTKEALINRVKISIYNRNIVEDELKLASSVVAALKQVTSFTKLALRPATFIKEMILGVIRNSSTVILNNFINDVPITFEHLRKAANVVYTNGLFINNGFAPDDETFGDFRLVGALNNLYRINDRDLNLLGESIAYDNHGVMHWGSRMLYLNTTAPDWFNRMTLLVAKMMADGTWEAHSLSPDGHIIYDPTKDKRFARFLSFYKNHPDLKEEPTDEEYVLAKAKYTLTIEQLKREGYTDLKASDAEGYSIIPICYTEQEMSSVKEQIGMLYGYYSHEERTIMQKSIAWLLHTQFLTFLPAEIKKYFARGDMESSVGKVVHMTEPFTGKKLYYITNDAGLTEVVNEDELTYDQKTRPVIEFVKTPIEGLLVSTAKTLSLVWHGERKNIPKEQLDRTKLFFFNLLIWALLKALLVGLGVLAVQKGKASKEEKKQIDAIAATSRIINSVGQELNIMEELESAISSMGITGYDQIKSLMGSTMSKIVNNPQDWFAIINLMGAVKDFQII